MKTGDRAVARMFLKLSASLILGITTTTFAQSTERMSTLSEARITTARAIPQIAVYVELQAGKEQMVVARCGETIARMPILCTSRARLEVQTQKGWKAAKLRTTYGVLGGPPRGQEAGLLVAADERASIAYVFSRRFFEVDSGQMLRVVVDTWPNERSMKDGGPPGQLVSPSFECPESGVGR